jgi:hypothetical protein
LLRRDAADPGGGLENVVTDGGRRGDAGRPRADQVAEPLLDLLIAIGDQLLFDREVVVDRLLGDLGLTRHVSDGDVLIAAIGEQAGGGIGDVPPGARLLELAQSHAGHTSEFSEGARRLVTHSI